MTPAQRRQRPVTPQEWADYWHAQKEWWRQTSDKWCSRALFAAYVLCPLFFAAGYLFGRR